MKKTAIILFILIPILLNAQYPNGKDILDKIDQNMSAKSTIYTSKMIIHGNRGDRTVESKSWIIGDKKAYTEYLNPARERGTKMLKLEDQLWLYSPSTDRTIQIAGHMLRQSVMGSDLSYEDMMDDSKLSDHYSADVIREETIVDRKCWVIEMNATDNTVSYPKRIVWVDIERNVPLKEELYAKGGKLLKKTELYDVKKVSGRWYPMRIVFKDMLKEGEGTEFIVDEIEFNKDIPEAIFSKGSLKK
ncbi:MAG: outer membrane lipoprotein-sorting protein [Bacteroidales bacterium]|nr:outer membrane lipoprotein-sorting protein [Bacteroidales bacterium]MCF8389915.1 outer membrane lipoprotein-sorting protein [Bacteroidales bacterium]